MPTYGDNPPGQKPGRPIRARTLSGFSRRIGGLTRGVLGGQAVQSQSAIAGIPLSITVGGSLGVAIVKSHGTVNKRVGTQPGTGKVYLQTYDGTILSDGAEVDCRYIIATDKGDGKYGVAFKLGSYWWPLFEC